MSLICILILYQYKYRTQLYKLECSKNRYILTNIIQQYSLTQVYNTSNKVHNQISRSMLASFYDSYKIFYQLDRLKRTGT